LGNPASARHQPVGFGSTAAIVGAIFLEHDYSWKTNEILAAYEWRCFGGMVVKVAVEFPFEAVLGKTRLRFLSG